ncbi:MAG: prepilin-type N-terminal cleavage/methylation domain-containing protein [Planctomycetota bacterium]|jgi:type II secretory pathway pseudopilin PulG
MKNKAMTLVEVIIAMTVMALLILGIGSAFVSSSALRKVTEEQIAASNIAESQIEQMRARMKRTTTVGDTNFTNLDSLIAFYSQQANQTFDVTNLPNAAGTLNIYLDESQVPVEVDATATTMTNADGESFGPLDLDGDDGAEAGFQTENHSAAAGSTYGANMVPVEIKITWRTAGGAQTAIRKFNIIARTDDE